MGTRLIDLASPSPAAQTAQVERLLALGATPADVGQRDVTWTVLADPEGNEFCVCRRAEQLRYHSDMDTKAETLLTSGQVARELSTTVPRLLRAVRSGEVPTRRRGNRFLFDAALPCRRSGGAGGSHRRSRG